MSGYRKYALFDWDNTIRRGYTLYSWVEYLHQCNITSIYLQKKLEILKQQYIKSEITHVQIVVCTVHPVLVLIVR